MDDWIGIVVALAVGVPLLAVAVIVDLRRRRETNGQLSSAPVRGDADVDAYLPKYISQDDVDASPRPGAGHSSAGEFSGGARLRFGHADPDFATTGDVAELRGARVLMVDDGISSIRELLVPLGNAASGTPLVVAAASFHPDVMESLKANRRVANLPVVAVEANLAELMQLQNQVGGQLVEGSDLKAGWIPANAWGVAVRWRSDRLSIHVQGEEPGQG